MRWRWSICVGVLGAAALALAVKAQAPGTAATPPPKGKTPGTPPSDVELVERVLAARKEYQVSLEQLRAHYISVGDLERARWAEEELKQFHRLVKQAYRLELDVPPPTLQATYNIPEANELYRRAMTYKEHGWGTDYIDNQRRAELLLQQLLTSHPQSDKIGDAAYQLGDLYQGKAFAYQYRRAAAYFERSFQWNPTSQLDGRLRAARIYDKSLHEQGKAIELYKDVTTHETDPNRLKEAQQRLAELNGGK
jgi:hypothetical protein